MMITNAQDLIGTLEVFVEKSTWIYLLAQSYDFRINILIEFVFQLCFNHIHYIGFRRKGEKNGFVHFLFAMPIPWLPYSNSVIKAIFSLERVSYLVGRCSRTLDALGWEIYLRFVNSLLLLS